MKISRGASIDRYYLLRLFGYGVFLHRIHTSDPKGIYHSHPWNAVSFLLRGSYNEERILPDDFRRIRWINLIKAPRLHRVEVESPVWTLVIHARRSNRWQVNNGTETVSLEPFRGPGEGRTYHP